MFDRFRQELVRYRRRPFLEAVAGACALVAKADGEVSFSERSRLDAVIDSLSQLSVYDPHEVVDAFNQHVEAIEDDREAGRAAALEAIRVGAGEDDDAAALVLRIAVAMSLADGRDSAQENAVVEEIRALLALEAASVRAAYAEFGG